MPGRSRKYFLADRAQDGPGRDQATLTELAPDYLRSLNMPGLPPSKLELKDSAPIMLIRSFRQEEQPHPFQRLSLAVVDCHGEAETDRKLDATESEQGQLALGRIIRITARIIACDFKGAEDEFPTSVTSTARHTAAHARTLAPEDPSHPFDGSSGASVLAWAAICRAVEGNRCGNLSVLHVEGSDATENVVFPEQRFQHVAI
ncbi:hypothetical protein N7461_002722 [Penicillium sp. DV-2018c]|nr:hypothetical protein N7461_002722 [Penicillium sp. DV-2018c]